MEPQRMCIALVGKAGTGKGVTGKKLVIHPDLAALNFKHLSVGDDIFVPMARLRGVSPREYELLGRIDPHIDESIDAEAVRLCGEHPRVVIDSRRVPELISSAYAVLLYCPDDNVRFQRVADRSNGKLTFQQAKEQTIEREAAFCERHDLRQEDFLHPEAFIRRPNSMAINTQVFDEVGVVATILSGLRRHYNFSRPAKPRPLAACVA